MLCVLHAGGKFGGDDSGYKVSGGLHGVGISVVNALSEELDVEVKRDERVHRMRFSRGQPLGDIQIDDAAADVSSGTRVRFLPDPQIFKTALVFDAKKLAARLDELAYLNAGLTIHLVDERLKGCEAFQRGERIESVASGVAALSIDRGVWL